MHAQRGERMLVRDMLTSNRWLVVLGVAVAAIVVASVAVAVLLGDEEQTFAEGTPEAVVQTYLRTVRDRDPAAAAALFTEDLRGRCDADELRQPYYSDRGFHATIRNTYTRRDTRDGDDLRVVDVRISQAGDGGPFGSGAHQHDHVVVLMSVDGSWLISGPPWPIEYCTPRRSGAVPQREVEAGTRG